MLSDGYEYGPLLPVLSWEESEAKYAYAYPDRDGYEGRHRHRHEKCGHVSECGFAAFGEPCQAYEVHDDECHDCILAGANR